MDKIEKALEKLTDKERSAVKILLEKLYTNKIQGPQIARLKGYSHIYRILKGRLRIIFRMEGGEIYLESVEK